MDTWGPENQIESYQHDDNHPGISGDQTSVRWRTYGNYFWVPYSDDELLMLMWWT
jgi:hypothetical protein